MRAVGIDTLDTAIAYGESEQRLGELGISDLRVVSKIPASHGRPLGAVELEKLVTDSLNRLRIPALSGLLLHDAGSLLGDSGDALYRAMRGIKERGFAAKIGVSVYDPAVLAALVPRYQLDLVQAPFNVLDRRFETSGWLRRLHDAGTEVHVRSVFLQGLLLMDDTGRPNAFDRWNATWHSWREWLSAEGITRLEACIGFVLRRPEIDRVIIGVDNLAQLKDIVAAADAHVPEPPPGIVSDVPDLINPTRWTFL